MTEKEEKQIEQKKFNNQKNLLNLSQFFKKKSFNPHTDGELQKIKTSNQKEEERTESIIEKAGKSNVGEILKKLQPVVSLVTKIVDTVSPPIQLAIDFAHKAYLITPIDLIFAVIGLILTFFGGYFAVTISACEAFYNSGYEVVTKSAEYLWTEYKILWKKSREDDAKDEDNDGVADVLQISARELLTRKISFFFAHCSDPQKMMDMIYGIANSLMAVIAVLKVQFAKVIALGIAIGENLRKPATVIFVPIFSTCLPTKYHQWISPSINLVCKSIAITIAWYIQRVISAVESAIRGGLMFSRRTLAFLNSKGYINLKEEDTFLDEIVGWLLAAIGIYFQLKNIFGLPFPLNLLLFPISTFENILIWIISE